MVFPFRLAPKRRERRARARAGTRERYVQGSRESPAANRNRSGSVLLSNEQPHCTLSVRYPEAPSSASLAVMSASTTSAWLRSGASFQAASESASTTRPSNAHAAARSIIVTASPCRPAPSSTAATSAPRSDQLTAASLHGLTGAPFTERASPNCDHPVLTKRQASTSSLRPSE